MAFLRVVLLAFLGSLAWFIWAVATETNGSCFGAEYYVPSAAIALAIVVAVEMALEAFLWRRGPGTLSRADLAGVLLTTAALTAAGLLVGGFFAAVASCSA